MKIKLNGKDIEIETENKMSIVSLLVWKGIIPSTVVVEYNYQIPEREIWQDIELKDGDNIEIIKFMGGG